MYGNDGGDELGRLGSGKRVGHCRPKDDDRERWAGTDLYSTYAPGPGDRSAAVWTLEDCAQESNSPIRQTILEKKNTPGLHTGGEVHTGEVPAEVMSCVTPDTSTSDLGPSPNASGALSCPHPNESMTPSHVGEVGQRSRHTGPCTIK